MLHTVALVLANAVGLLASLMAIVMLMAGGANAKPVQIRQIKVMMATAALAGLAPAAFVIVLVAVLVYIQW